MKGIQYISQHLFSFLFPIIFLLLIVPLSDLASSLSPEGQRVIEKAQESLQKHQGQEPSGQPILVKFNTAYFISHPKEGNNQVKVLLNFTYNDPCLALKSFKRDLFNLALLDIRMPHMDGFKLFEQIRKKDDKIRVYFMTAFEVYRDQFGQLPSSDIQHIIEKPVDMIELKQILTRSSDFLMSLYNS